MVERLERIARTIPDVVVDGPSTGDLLILGWGSTYGAIAAAVNTGRDEGLSVSRAHLRHLNPFPRNLSEVMAGFKKVLIPEMNGGQLALLIRGRYLVDAISYTKMQGKPFFRSEIMNKAREILEADADVNAATSDGATPLLFAAITGNRSVCDLLGKIG